MSAPAYVLDDVVREYGGRTALAIQRLEIRAGEILALAGPNGSGKSTLLSLLAFLSRPTRGRISFFGAPAVGDPVALRRQAPLLLQEPYLLRRSVLGNVIYPLKVRGERELLAERAAEALEMVGLDFAAFSGRRWFELSGGEAQRVALAARLAIRPRVLLLDEPTASVDVASSRRILEAVARAREELGTTVVVASHDREWAEELADRTLELRPVENGPDAVSDLIRGNKDNGANGGGA